MTTVSWTGFLDHTNDAGFRAWGSELSTKLAAVGLVQTADTGQINWTTVTRPGSGASAGYEIWRFADSSLYLKWEYGTGTAAATPMMWITVGTGSNGSGTLTGQLSTRSTIAQGVAANSTVTNYTSRLCRVADALALNWKEAMGTSLNGGALIVGKTVDGTGAATVTGFAVLRGNSSGVGQYSMQCVRTAATAATGTDTIRNLCIPGEPTSSVVAGGNTQAYQIPGNFPDVQPFAWAVIAVLTEASRGTSFSVAMVGSVSHTYVSFGQYNTQTLGGGYAAATYAICGIWE